MVLDDVETYRCSSPFLQRNMQLVLRRRIGPFASINQCRLFPCRDEREQKSGEEKYRDRITYNPLDTIADCNPIVRVVVKFHELEDSVSFDPRP